MLKSWFHRTAAALDSRTVTEDEAGQGLVEYGLILVLIAVVTIGVLTALGTSIVDILNNVAGAF